MKHILKKKDGVIEIFEKATHQTLLAGQDKTKISSYLEFLRGGGAFNGWTPTFFLVKPIKMVEENCYDDE